MLCYEAFRYNNIICHNVRDFLVFKQEIIKREKTGLDCNSDLTSVIHIWLSEKFVHYTAFSHVSSIIVQSTTENRPEMFFLPTETCLRGRVWMYIHTYTSLFIYAGIKSKSYMIKNKVSRIWWLCFLSHRWMLWLGGSELYWHQQDLVSSQPWNHIV